MHRHVRRVGDQVAFGVEQRAGKIEPLLDVDRVRGVGERHAHLLGDRHEQVVEHLEQHRIGGGADRMRALRGLDAVEHEVVARREASRASPARSPSSRSLADHRGAGDRIALAADRRGRTRRRRETRRRCRSRSVLIGVSGPARGAGALVVGGIGAADRLDRDRLDDQRLARHQEPVLLRDAVCARTRRTIAAIVAGAISSVGVGAFVFEVQRARVAMRCAGDALLRDLARAPRPCFERGNSAAIAVSARPTVALRPPAASARARRRVPCRTPTARRRADG